MQLYRCAYKNKKENFPKLETFQSNTQCEF